MTHLVQSLPPSDNLTVVAVVSSILLMLACVLLVVERAVRILDRTLGVYERWLAMKPKKQR